MWPGEATHFTPWLAANLDWLDGLGLGPLELVGTEVMLPTVNRALDILARTTDGRAVAIENQYLRTDHDHLTRGLAYAVGHRARALVVIAEDHGEEFLAIAAYLNEAYEQLGHEVGIAVFLVRLTVEKVVDVFVPRFSIAARPNTWLTAVHAEQDQAPVTLTGFLESVAPSVRDTLRGIIEAWVRRPGASMRLNPKSGSASLDYPYLPGQGQRSIFVLYGTGIMTVNRGYFIELGGLTEDQVREFDGALRTHFPDLSAKPYYPATATLDPVRTAAFEDWLIEWMAATHLPSPPSDDLE